MTKAVLVCCSLDAEPSLAGTLLELDRAGLHVDVVSGVDEDFLPFGRALDRLDEPGIAVLLIDATLPPMSVRRLEGVFSARKKPGHEMVRLSLDPTEPPQAIARAILEAARGRAAHGPEVPRREPHDAVRNPPSPPHPHGGPVTSANDAAFGPPVPPADAGRRMPRSESPAVSDGRAPPPPGTPFPTAVAPQPTPRPTAVCDASGRGPPTSGVRPSPSPSPFRRRSQGLIFAMAAVTGLVLTAAALRLLRNRRSPDPPPAPAGAPAEPAALPGLSPPAPIPSPAWTAGDPAPSRVPAAPPRAGGPPASERGANPGGRSSPSGAPRVPAAGSSGPPPRDDYEAREAVVIARALAKGRLRAINRLVLGVADPSPRTFEEASAACRDAVVAGVGNFHLPSRSELRALRRARLLTSGRYWTRARAPDDRRVILDTAKIGFDSADPAAPVAGIACVRRLPGP